MAQIDEWSDGVRTIREIVANVAGAESYYRRGLSDGVEDDSGAVSDLAGERDSLVRALRALRPEDRGRRFEPQRPWQSSPEHWTARKVLRRAIAHERFHTAEIRQRLAWLLLGVPEFRDDEGR
jgi:hypothetical protein